MTNPTKVIPAVRKAVYLALSSMLLMMSATAIAWNGEDADSGENINIHGPQLVNIGDQVFYTTGESSDYETGTIVSVFKYGSEVQLQVRDEQFGDIRQFQMEK